VLALALAILTGAPARAQDAAPAPDSATTAPPSAGTVTPAPAAERATSSAAPATTRRVRLVAGERHVIRTGPGDGFAVAAVHPEGATFVVIAKRGDWYGVRLSETETGWVHRSLCREYDDLADLEFRPNPRLYTRTGSFVLGGYAGGYAFDRKSNSLVLGGRLGYYVFDRLQAEGGVSWTRVRRPAEIVESLFDLTLEAEDFHMLFYQLGLTWELLPGRQMVPFLAAGAGSAIMRGRTEASLHFGAGTTMFLSKRSAMRWEVRDFVLDSGADDARRTHHNIEFTLGTAFLF
jgi:outer membrane beta-barrel protein